MVFGAGGVLMCGVRNGATQMELSNLFEFELPTPTTQSYPPPPEK